MEKRKGLIEQHDMERIAYLNKKAKKLGADIERLSNMDNLVVEFDDGDSASKWTTNRAHNEELVGEIISLIREDYTNKLRETKRELKDILIRVIDRLDRGVV